MSTTSTSSNWSQFSLLALVNLFVGGMVGLERTVVPLLAENAFGLERSIAVGAFVMSFGIAKAVTNLFARTLADRFGRKGVCSSVGSSVYLYPFCSLLRRVGTGSLPPISCSV